MVVDECGRMEDSGRRFLRHRCFIGKAMYDIVFTLVKSLDSMTAMRFGSAGSFRKPMIGNVILNATAC
jgi:hypothetical protein